MKRFLDVFTSIITRSADILFVKNPQGTSIGAFAGVGTEGLLKFFTPALNKYKDFFDLSQLQTYYFIAVGIVLFNLPIFFRRRELPKEVEDAFEAIRRSKGHLSSVQLRLQYLALCSEIIERAQIRPEKIARRGLLGEFICGNWRCLSVSALLPNTPTRPILT